MVVAGDDHLDTVTIRGKQSACDLAVAALMELVPTVDMLAVNPDYVRHLIGAHGENARKLMNEFDVFIKFPKQDASESQVVIKVP